MIMLLVEIVIYWDLKSFVLFFLFERLPGLKDKDMTPTLLTRKREWIENGIILNGISFP